MWTTETDTIVEGTAASSSYVNDTVWKLPIELKPGLYRNTEVELYLENSTGWITAQFDTFLIVAFVSQNIFVQLSCNTYSRISTDWRNTALHALKNIGYNQP